TPAWPSCRTRRPPTTPAPPWRLQPLRRRWSATATAMSLPCARPPYTWTTTRIDRAFRPGLLPRRGFPPPPLRRPALAAAVSFARRGPAPGQVHRICAPRADAAALRHEADPLPPGRRYRL